MPDYSIHLDSKDWLAAKNIARIAMNKDEKKPPFVLHKEDVLKQSIYSGIPFFDINHDIFVIKADNKDGFMVGIAANAEAYFPKEYLEEVEDIYDRIQSIKDDSGVAKARETKKIKDEGFLGQGGVGFVRVIKWENGTCDAVKVQVVDKEKTLLNPEKNEREALEFLQRLKVFFVDGKRVKVPGSVDKYIDHPSYTIEEIIPGKELSLYFRDIDAKRIAISDKQRINLALQAARAVKALHDQNIMHGDIHPGNFMVSYNGDALIVHAIDFGNSEILSDTDKVKLGSDIASLLANIFDDDRLGLRFISTKANKNPVAILIRKLQKGNVDIDQVISHLEDIYEQVEQDQGVANKACECKDKFPKKTAQQTIVKTWHDDSVLKKTSAKIIADDDGNVSKDDVDIKKAFFF